MNDSRINFLALGDSYTIGEGVTPEERWPSQLAEALRHRGLPIGAPFIIARTGWTVSELRAGIQSAALEVFFHLVSLQIGVNNQYRGYAVESYRREFAVSLAEAIAFAGGQASAVLVLSIPDWGVTPFAKGQDRRQIAAEIDKFNHANRAETIDAGANYIDVTLTSRLARQDSSLLAPDGLHPSGKMYAIWIDSILPAALKILGANSNNAGSIDASTGL
jgi:lysophospholipase L1-like esterase